MNHRHASIALLVAVGAVSTAFGIHEASVPNSAATPVPVDVPAARREPCALTPGDEAAFEISHKSVSKIDARALLDKGASTDGSALRSVAATVEARVDLRAIRRDGDATIVAARLGNLRTTLDKDGRAPSVDVSKPVLLRISPSCRMLGYAHPTDIRGDEARTAESILSTFDWTIEAGTASYQASFRDGRGELEARHTLHGNTVTRSITQATKLWRGVPTSTARIVSSGGQARFGEGPFLEQIGETDAIEQRTKDGLITELRYEIRATRVATSGRDPFEGVSLDPEGFVWGDHFADPAPEHPTAALDPSLAAIPVDAALVEMDRRMAEKNGAVATSRYLTAALRANPALATQLVSALARGQVSRSARAAMMLAMARADVPEARRALGSIAESHHFGEAERLEAVMHLGSAKGAGKLEAAALRRLEKDATAGVASTALLSLGALARSAGARDPELASAIRTDLDARMRAEPKPEKLTMIARAAGNTGDRALVPALSDLAANEDPRVRASAIGALERVPGTGDAVISLVGRETDPDVRREVLGQLAHESGRPNSDLTDLALRELPEERDSGTKRALVEILGRSETAEARTALVQLFQTEHDTGMRELLGRYVPSSDLLATR